MLKDHMSNILLHPYACVVHVLGKSSLNSALFNKTVGLHTISKRASKMNKCKSKPHVLFMGMLVKSTSLMISGICSMDN